jgi:NADPH:quinone reductase-like Zn-dependent oxidoreductase
MTSVLITGHGGNEVIQLGTLPKPVRAPGQVLVRMHAATLNRVDLYMRDSGAGITHALPQAMGVDGAGVIEEVDDHERQLRVGQRVTLHPALMCGRCEYCLRGEGVLCTAVQYLGEHRHGTLTPYVSLPAQNVFPIPDDLPLIDAAALGVNHLTAWRMLFTQARVRAGETVLIMGIGGGVSLAALQLAQRAGLHTIVTSRSDSKLAQAKAMGANTGIHSASQDLVKTVMAHTQGRGVDVVIENIGGPMWPLAMKSLARGGRLVTCGATAGDQPGADLRRIFIRQLQIYGSTLGDLHEFQALLRFVQQTGLRPVIDSVFPIEQIHQALDRLESGDQFGKVAVQMLPEPAAQV